MIDLGHQLVGFLALVVPAQEAARPAGQVGHVGAPLVKDQIEAGAQAIPAFLQRSDSGVARTDFEADYLDRNRLLQLANPSCVKRDLAKLLSGPAPRAPWGAPPHDRCLGLFTGPQSRVLVMLFKIKQLSDYSKSRIRPQIEGFLNNAPRGPAAFESLEFVQFLEGGLEKFDIRAAPERVRTAVARPQFARLLLRATAGPGSSPLPGIPQLHEDSLPRGVQRAQVCLEKLRDLVVGERCTEFQSRNRPLISIERVEIRVNLNPQFRVKTVVVNRVRAIQSGHASILAAFPPRSAGARDRSASVA
jgi:hypothetical protein